jgi:hypothetical protein
VREGYSYKQLAKVLSIITPQVWQWRQRPCVVESQQKWCPGPELNRYVSFETRDFKSRASASFATRAGKASKPIYQFVYLPKALRAFQTS